MFEHALDDAVGAFAMLGDLLEVAAQHLDDLVHGGSLVVAERRHRRGCRLLQLKQQFARQLGEVVDKIERVFDLVRDPRGELAELRHLLNVEHAGLRRLQLLQRLFGCVARRADLGLGALPFGDVAVDQSACWEKLAGVVVCRASSHAGPASNGEVETPSGPRMGARGRSLPPACGTVFSLSPRRYSLGANAHFQLAAAARRSVSAVPHTGRHSGPRRVDGPRKPWRPAF
jgi:hypothetical protein